MKHDVFISHAHKDKGVADAICGKLESAGLKCWIAMRDISAREDWTEATQKAIGSSRVVVVVLSENANAAPHIEREIAHAFYMRRIIIPFRLAETLPRREILFYFGDIPSVNARNPPAEEDLEALTARIRGVLPGSPGAGNATPSQTKRKKTAPVSPSNSWFSALEASHYRTFGTLKWVAITSFLCAVVSFLWFALRQTTEWASLAESHRRSLDHGFSLSPTPSSQGGGDASEPKQTSSFTRFAQWQAANSSPAPTPTPLLQGPLGPSLNAQAVPSANATSSPQRDLTAAERAGGVASEPRPRHLPPVAYRVSHDHHPQFPGTQVKEARRIADLESQRDSLQSQRDSLQSQRDSLESQRDSLQSQLKDIVANLLATQKNADLVTGQRDELQNRLNESEEKAQVAKKNADLVKRQRDELQNQLNESEEKTQFAQKNANIMASELDDLQHQLKETENRALTAQKNEELVRTQRDALQTRLRETESDAQAAQKNADLATRQRDALQSEMGEMRERAQLAETNANLAASQRDAMEAELKKKEEEEAPEKKAQANQHGADLAELSESAPDTQFQVVQQHAQHTHEDAEFAQTQPPNPGQNAKPAPLTQALDPFVQPTAPPSN
jgi:TIR domain